MVEVTKEEQEEMVVDWDKVDTAFQQMKAQRRPEGSFTFEEYADRKDMSISGAKKRLAEMVRKGYMEKHWSPGRKAYFTLREKEDE